MGIYAKIGRSNKVAFQLAFDDKWNEKLKYVNAWKWKHYIDISHKHRLHNNNFNRFSYRRICFVPSFKR